ncbi:MAG: carbonic anhydrase [Vicinamibacteria bacterium]
MSEDAFVCTAEEALSRLVSGNERFAAGRPQPRPAGPSAELVAGQRPFATILGCSDSRVPPELLFDADFGELFVIRVAGNLILPAVMGSIQYASVHLHTPLFMILGHEGCGAVKAALAALHQGAVERSRIQILLESIKPGLEGMPAGVSDEEQLLRGVEANVRWSMHQLLDTPEGRARLAEGHLKLVGGVYELATGRVRVLES